MVLLGPEYPVTCISQPGQYIAVLIELPVNGCRVNMHIRVCVAHDFEHTVQDAGVRAEDALSESLLPSIVGAIIVSIGVTISMWPTSMSRVTS